MFEIASACRTASLLLAASLSLASLSIARQEPSAPSGRPAPAGNSPWRLPEALEMLGTILKDGAEMGPRSGWFHPGQTRHDWPALARRYDADSDGAITAAELPASPSDFGRLDRDGDGRIVADDLDWSEEASYVRARAQARARFGMFDHNSNGRISADEWQKFFQKAAKGKAFLTSEDLADALYGNPPRVPKRDDSSSKPVPGEAPPSRWTLLLGLLSGEIGSLFEGPALGDPAPDFALKTFTLDRSLRLAELKGDKPIVLIFGSFT
jgi:hypothetical protein